jgi:hypothetical protein
MRPFLDEKRAQLQRQKMVRGADLIAHGLPCPPIAGASRRPTPILAGCYAACGSASALC